MNNTDPVSGYPPYRPDHSAHPQPYAPEQPVHRRDGGRRAALTICTIADTAAALLGLWILLYLLEANRANVFVTFVHGTADWLAWWSQDIFTMDTEWVRAILNYGLPAVLYLLIGHGIAARLSR